MCSQVEVWRRWRAGLASLQVLQPAVADLPELTELVQLCGNEQRSPERLAAAAAAAASIGRRLWASGCAWPEYIADRVVWTEHPLGQWAEQSGAGASLPPELIAAARRELALLQELAGELPAQLTSALRDSGWLFGELAWPPHAAAPAETAFAEFSDAARALAATADWADALPDLLRIWATYGNGPLGRYDAFRWDGRGQRLVPVLRPDPVTLADLKGYETQRQAVLANTEQFVAGHPANNLLLYGDRGTGKSSLVKALRPAYGPQGLRLIEVAKEDLGDLPVLLPQLTGRRGRFILFIDDLSFGDGEDYRGLKAVLEGSLVARPDNVLVYATTNRRHLVHETRGERIAASADGEAAHAARLAQGGEAALNPRDVLQEKLSLADRFGQTIRFPAPDQQQYLDIVTHLARQRGLDMPLAELHERALRWAQWHNGRSGRTARQFLDDLSGRLGREDDRSREPVAQGRGSY